MYGLYKEKFPMDCIKKNFLKKNDREITIKDCNRNTWGARGMKILNQWIRTLTTLLHT